MNKNQMKNLGIPLSVNVKRDMPAVKNGSFDSWYVICNFESEGQKFAFEWHQQEMKFGPIGRMVTAEFLITNGTRDICKHNAITVKEGIKAGASSEKLHVFTQWGGMDGDETKMTLKLNAGTEAVDVVLVPTNQVLYNGTTGLLHFGSNDSYEFAFPNMAISGTLTFEGKSYEIKNATAWFDRQWGYELSKTESVGKQKGMFQQSWLWLGMVLTDTLDESISLWDAYLKEGRHTFATFIHADGSQNNTLAQVSYEDIYTSKKSGNKYPRIFNIKVPQEDLDIRLESMITDPEFYREKMGLSGCQCLCHVTGTYKGKKVDKDNVVEMINDVCGDAY